MLPFLILNRIPIKKSSELAGGDIPPVRRSPKTESLSEINYSPPLRQNASNYTGKMGCTGIFFKIHSVTRDDKTIVAAVLGSFPKHTSSGNHEA